MMDAGLETPGIAFGKQEFTAEEQVEISAIS